MLIITEDFIYVLTLFLFWVRINENNNSEKPTIIIIMFLVIKIEFGNVLFKIFNVKYNNMLRLISIIKLPMENSK